jgi:prepilin-type processing-associated H-X9-DG protein
LKRSASILALSVFALSCGVVVVGLISGCSGGSGQMNNPATAPSTAGSLVMHIAWPKTSSRLIPAATTSIQISIGYPSGGTAIATATIPQGQNTATIGNLPVASLILTASALEASGAVTAAGSTSVTTIANQQVPVPLSLTSTIDHLVIAPANPTVMAGSSTPLSASGVNTSGAMVLLTPGKLTWQMETPADALFGSVDSNGNVTGIAAGPATVEVTDTESGKSATVLVTVTGNGQAQDQVTCMSQLKQIGLALVEYEEDYDEKLPGGLSGYGSGSGWAGQVYPYIKSTSVFQCPADNGDGVQGNPAGTGPWRSSSYALNSDLVITEESASGCNGAGDGLPLAEYNSPAQTVLLFEVTNSTNYNVDTELYPVSAPAPKTGTFGNCGGSAAGNGIGGAFAPAGYNSTGDPTGPSDGYLQYAVGYLNGETKASDRLSFSSPTGRHLGGANYAMGDGHVKYLLPSAVSPGLNAASATSNQIDDNGVATPHAAGTSGYFSDGKTTPSATFSIY